jgi:hypothetical protein
MLVYQRVSRGKKMKEECILMFPVFTLENGSMVGAMGKFGTVRKAWF